MLQHGSFHVTAHDRSVSRTSVNKHAVTVLAFQAVNIAMLSQQAHNRTVSACSIHDSLPQKKRNAHITLGEPLAKCTRRVQKRKSRQRQNASTKGRQCPFKDSSLAGDNSHAEKREGTKEYEPELVCQILKRGVRLALPKAAWMESLAGSPA